MKCYLHLEDEIVAQCQACSRGLCSECSNMYQSPTCQNCAAEQNRRYRGTLIRQLLISVGIFFLIFSSMANDSKAHNPLIFSLLVAYMAAGIPWGWAVLNRVTPNVFLFLPVIGWLFYFGVKFYLSGMVGFFVTPFKIYRAIGDIREISRSRVDLETNPQGSLTLVK